MVKIGKIMNHLEHRKKFTRYIRFSIDELKTGKNNRTIQALIHLIHTLEIVETTLDCNTPVANSSKRCLDTADMKFR